MGVATLIATIVLWQGLVVREREQAQRVVQNQAMYLRSTVAGPIEAQIGALEKLAHRWETSQPSHAQWVAAASEYLRPPARYHALEIVDSALRLQWFVPAAHAQATGVSAEVRSRALDEARSGGSTVVSPLVDLADGREGFYVVAPVVRDGSFSAAIVGLFPLTEMLEEVFKTDAHDYGVAVLERSRRAYLPGEAADESAPLRTEVGLAIRGARWQLRIWPTPDRQTELEGPLPYLVLAGGLLLSAVVACMTFFAGTSRRRERELREQMKEREAAQEALRASEEQYRSLIDSATDIIYRVDPRGHFTFVNPVASRVMHRPQADLIGVHFLELVEPSWRTDVARFYAAQVTNRTAQTYFEFPATSGDSRTVWIGQSVHCCSTTARSAACKPSPETSPNANAPTTSSPRCATRRSNPIA